MSTGVSRGAVGGIAAGIVVGFLVIGAIAAVFLLRARPRYNDMGYPANEQTGMEAQAEPKWENQTNQNVRGINDLPSGRVNE